jgi:tetratricopeptide (TPR) repeat protein
MAQRILADRASLAQMSVAAQRLPAKPTPESYLDLSLHEYQAGRFEKSITAAKKALELRPNYAEAYNNIAAAYNSMAKWDEGIQAALQAVRLKPDYQLAKNNMMWAVSQKQKAQGSNLRWTSYGRRSRASRMRGPPCPGRRHIRRWPLIRKRADKPTHQRVLEPVAETISPQESVS